MVFRKKKLTQSTKGKVNMKKKLIPILVAIVLMIVIGAGALGSVVLKKYSYSDIEMNLEEYFNLTEEDQVAIVLQNEHIDTKAKLYQGVYYLDFNSVKELLNDRFYHDAEEKLVLYTTPTEIIRTSIGSDTYTVGEEMMTPGYIPAFYEGETLYIALDYIRNYTNFSYESYSSPNRMQLTTEWGETTTAEIKKNTQIRYRGGVKSEILREMEKGETVTILEETMTLPQIIGGILILGFTLYNEIAPAKKEQ